jgi:acid phosphatase type 7
MSEFVPPAQYRAIQRARQLVFHCTGDTGYFRDPDHQHIVALHMERQCYTPRLADRPAFFYHLGDVVYLNGEAAHYYEQFYEPYMNYPAPIVAIPGNHDGDIDPHAQPPPVPSLDAFVSNFCDTAPRHTPEARDANRDSMTQPNSYWTLLTPLVTIIGLYTNVPDCGQLDASGTGTQEAWFHQELATADPNLPVIVALHHPAFSLDKFHGASDEMRQVIDTAAAATGRIPDIVLSAHVHNFQRFTRTLNGRQVPYIVAGSGGYYNLHHMAATYATPCRTPWNDVTLENYLDNRHGFMRLTVTAQSLLGEFYGVPRPQESWRGEPILHDRFELDLVSHRLLPNPGP